MDDARIDAATTAYRGFLFSDMRGFTAFAERHGNSAAAAKVSRFLDIARTAIARHQGAEIKTEGDAIHAVFPSASSAVLCGLEIQDAAAALNAQEPERPIGLGVGVHAGEAVETAEGYIGRAVNIAARLCSAAQPGEVLVSSTVKGITQASIQVGFIPRGRRRLKGIEDPIVVYAVTRDMTARAARSMPRPALLGAAGVAVAALIAIVALGSSLLPGTATASPSPTAAPTAQPVVIGPLPVGAYSPPAFQPSFTFRIADAGWTANRDVPELFALIREASPRGSIYFARVREVLPDPCIQGGEGATGPTSPDVIAELSSLAHVELSGLRTVEISGVSGRQLDVTIDSGALAACGGLVGAEVALFGIGDEVWSASPSERFRVIVLDVGADPVTILLSLDWAVTSSVQELESLFTLGDDLLGTVKF